MSQQSSSGRIIDYLPKDIGGHEIIEEFRKRRGGELLNLDRILLHSPTFASGWNHLFGTLRGSSIAIDSKLRELSICTIAVLNNADYEFYQHEEPWRLAGGTEEQIAAIRAVHTTNFDPKPFNETELRVI